MIISHKRGKKKLYILPNNSLYKNNMCVETGCVYLSSHYHFYYTHLNLNKGVCLSIYLLFVDDYERTVTPSFSIELDKFRRISSKEMGKFVHTWRGSLLF